MVESYTSFSAAIQGCFRGNFAICPPWQILCKIQNRSDYTIPLLSAFIPYPCSWIWVKFDKTKQNLLSFLSL